MKKTLILLLAVILMLTSCQLTVKNTKSPNVFTVDTLPDIGSFSGLSSEKRFYDEPVYDFIPSDEYGTIIPYVGTYRVFETPKEEGSDWHFEQGYTTYGFCTTDGRIVMDASDSNTYVNYRDTGDGFGFYTVTREIQPKDDAPDEYIPDETWVIALDGSWCLKLSPGAWVSNAGGGYINVCDYPEEAANSNVRTCIYNYHGKLVKVIDGVDSTGGFSNGLLLVSHWTGNGSSSYFVNENGEVVFGPFSYASDFNKYGVAAVQDEYGSYLLNTSGERLTEYYENIYKEYTDDAQDNIFSARPYGDSERCDIYSGDGNFLGMVVGTSYASFRFPDDGRIIYYYTTYDTNKNGYALKNSERMIWRYLDTGEDFVGSQNGVSPNSYSGTDNCFVYVDKENKKGLVFDKDGKTIAELDGVSEVVSTSEYGEYVIFVEGEYDYEIDELTGKPKKDTRKTHIYDSNKKEIVYTVDSYSYAYFADKNKRFIEISVYDAEDMYDMYGGEPKYTLFDTLSGKAVFENCNDISVCDVNGKTYINVTTANSTLLCDEKFEIIRKSYFE